MKLHFELIDYDTGDNNVRVYQSTCSPHFNTKICLAEYARFFGCSESECEQSIDLVLSHKSLGKDSIIINIDKNTPIVVIFDGMPFNVYRSLSILLRDMMYEHNTDTLYAVVEIDK